MGDIKAGGKVGPNATIVRPAMAQRGIHRIQDGFVDRPLGIAMNETTYPAHGSGSGPGTTRHGQQVGVERAIRVEHPRCGEALRATRPGRLPHPRTVFLVIE